ncbi:MAG: hypothetical protein AAF757_04975 [Cyanobacteria bacterium P01_D01_bin.116]
MKFNQIIAIVVIVTVVIVTSNTTVTPTKILGKSTSFQSTLFLEERKERLQLSQSNFVELGINSKKSSLCNINQSSTFSDWINLLGRLIILGSFSCVGVMGNSVLIQRYVKLIFKDVLPVFAIVFLSLSLLGIAVIYFSSSAALTTSLNSQTNCIFK